MSDLYSRMRVEKLNITGKLVDGNDAWDMTIDPRSKYAAAKMPGGGTYIRYYGRGVKLISSLDWESMLKRSELVFNGEVWRPSTEWVLWISLASGIEATHVQTVRKGKSTGLVCSFAVDRVSSKYRTSTGISMDVYNQMNIVDVTINYRNGGVTFRGSINNTVSLETSVGAEVDVLETRTNDLILELKNLWTNKLIDMASSPVGQEYLTRFWLQLIPVTNVGLPHMTDIRRWFVKELIRDEIDYWREEVQKDLSVSASGEWIQEAYAVIAKELWDNMLVRRDPFVEMHSYESFYERALVEHSRSDSVWSNAEQASPKSRLALPIPLSRLSNPYWYCGDRRSHFLFMDLRIGLYCSSDIDVKNGSQPDEWELLEKNPQLEDELRQLAVSRWMEMHGKDDPLVAL